ncbi:MAG: tRNA (adenosine(37)-N6)-dimethylallyltransferase MiaA [Chitinispirillaceae bacterium]|nr:tRNA (adenosine(37)-N6)-dimethylallyltransferase MiaA [Chitinispirillaceae bacterium]
MVKKNNQCNCASASSKISVAVLVGPTAVGKSEIAFRIAEEMGWDIISCDSRQVYKGMDIGTAKPDRIMRDRVKHWLIDIIDPKEQYSAAQFVEDSLKIIRELAKIGKGVIICGGTGLYLSALTDGITKMVPSDPVLREELMKAAREKGSEILYEELKKVDLISAKRIHKNDIQRIVRALCVYRQTGIPISQHKHFKLANDINFIIAKIFMDREKLYERINKRVESMFENGLWEEFIALREKSYTKKDPGMQTLGYKELFLVEERICSFSEVKEIIKKNTRNYAKRQITWFTNKINSQLFFAPFAYEAIKNYYLEGMKL